MTPEEAIEIVKARARGRTQYAGQEPRVDEVLVAEIERLREELEWERVRDRTFRVDPEQETPNG